MIAVPGTVLVETMRSHLVLVPKVVQELARIGPLPDPLVPLKVEGVPMERQMGPHGGARLPA